MLTIDREPVRHLLLLLGGGSEEGMVWWIVQGTGK